MSPRLAYRRSRGKRSARSHAAIMATEAVLDYQYNASTIRKALANLGDEFWEELGRIANESKALDRGLKKLKERSG